MIVSILGTDYSVNIISRDEDKRFLSDESMTGLCDFTSKKINIINQVDEAVGVECAQEKLEELEKQVLMHELCHAFLRESGLDEESRDEKLCDWMSIQIPKIMDAYKKSMEVIDLAHNNESGDSKLSVRNIIRQL